MKCANDFLPLVERLNEAIAAAETILIGAGAGLSTSAGFTYSGERFEKYFSDFGAKYGFTDMYSGGFYPFKTLEELGVLEPLYYDKPLYRRTQAGI